MALSRLSIDLAVDLAGFESDLGRAARVTEREMNRIENQAKRLAQRAGAALGAGLAAGFVAATKAAADFEKSMAEVSTLLDDTSSLDSMTASVKSLAKEFGKAPTQQAEALYQIISSGAEAGSEAIEVLTAANKLAVGGITDLKTAADGLTNVLNAYGDEAGTVSDISDKFFAAMKAGKTTVGELAGSIGPVISTAKELGVSFDELVAAGATLTTTGVSTQQAFNNLRAVFANIIKPSKQASDLAEELGIQFRASALESQTFAEFLAQVQKATNGNIEQMAQLFGSVEGLNAVLALTGSSAETFAATLDGIQESAGETEKAVDKVATTVAHAFERLKSAISVELIQTGDLEGLAETIDSVADNIDLLFNSIKALAALLGGAFLGKVLLVTTSLKAMIAQIGVARIAIIGLTGVFGLLALAAGSVVTGYQRVKEIMASASADIVKSTNLLYGQADALLAVGDAAGVASLQIDLAEKVSSTTTTIANLERQLDSTRAVFDSMVQSGRASGNQLLELTERIEELELDLKNARAVLEATKVEMAEAAEAGETLARAAEDADQAAAGAVMSIKELDKALKAAVKAGQASSKALDDVVTALGELISTQDRVQDLIDTLDPVSAQFRKFAEMAELAKQNARTLEDAGYDLESVLRLIDLQARETILGMLGLSNASGDAADNVVSDSDRMREAVLEGVRQMTQAFGNMWADILSGAEDSFDSIRDAFAAMFGNLIHSATTQKIQLQFEQAFGAGGGGFSDLDLAELGKNFGAVAAAEFSDDIIKALFGDQAADQYIDIGKQIGTAAGAIIGSIFPGGTAPGAALGSLLGSLAGGIFGKLFGRDPLLTLGGSGFQQRDGQAQIVTPLGEITSFRARGKVGGFSDTDLPGFEIGQAIEEFDQAIYQVLQAIGGEDQLAVIQEALRNWGGTWTEGAITIENILGSRFDAILETFDADIRQFVDRTADFEEQINRFGVALSAQKLFEDRPDLFGEAGLSEFLDLVESFKGELGDLGQAFEQVATQLVEIAGLTQFLGEFSASDLESEFNAFLEAQNRSVGEALAGVNSRLMDAVANFDGSIEGLQEIAGLVATVREGEIRYLTQLDELQKGLNANIETLRNEVLGLTAPDPDVDQLLGSARDLIAQVLAATSVEDIADLERQFSAIIRSIDTEDATFRQVELLGLIDDFQSAANAMIEGFRENAIDNAENVRDLVGTFITDIGTPLDILVASNERIAEAVESLAGTSEANDFSATDPVIVDDFASDGGVADQVIAANSETNAQMNETMRRGLDEIAIAVERGRHDDAMAVVDAIRSAQFPVTVVVDGEGFTQ